jgi:MFS family permease
VIGFFWVAPLLVVGIFAVGFKEVALGSLLPVYGVRIGLSESTATLMLFFGAIGAAVMQFPIGWAADVFNVRKVFVSCAILSLSGAIIWPLVINSPFLLWPILFLWAGSYAGFYTISMILAGQWFKGSELATAMAAFGVFWGIGAFAGPAVSGIAMDVWDPYGLPFILVTLSLVIFVLSLKSTFYRPRRV